MALLKKKFVHKVLLTTFLSLFFLNLYSQEQTFDLIVFKDTVILQPPYVPVVFDIKHLNVLKPVEINISALKPLLPPVRLSKHRLFSDVYNKNEIYCNIYDSIVKKCIRHINYTTAHFSGKVEPLEEIKSNIFHFLFKIEDEIDNEHVAKPGRFTPKRRYWTLNGNSQIKFSQNYISENWHQGGMKNLNLYSYHTVKFKYNKKKFSTDNTFEWKLNIYDNPKDTIRNYRVGEDLVRVYSVFGIPAFKKWSYSTNIEIKSQIFKRITENTNDAISSFFSPLYINVGILGMKYQTTKTFPKVKGKKVDFNTDISPLSIQYVVVLNKSIDPKRFGIEEGKNHLINYGSTINANLSVFFNKNVNLTSRFHYFTNFEVIRSELENRLNMPINRFFSTSLNLYIRFDDNKKLKKNEKYGYFQINELLSFGFNYTW